MKRLIFTLFFLLVTIAYVGNNYAVANAAAPSYSTVTWWTNANITAHVHPYYIEDTTLAGTYMHLEIKDLLSGTDYILETWSCSYPYAQGSVECWANVDFMHRSWMLYSTASAIVVCYDDASCIAYPFEFDVYRDLTLKRFFPIIKSFPGSGSPADSGHEYRIIPPPVMIIEFPVID